jgi:pyruvate/2-oxoglutarate dehydrogenase complex dihydrolipoamide dehydrogenase (E3) component
MTRMETDICVIGAGSGGLSVAAGAVQMGASVVLIEGAEMGGDCLNHGCVPSKALLAAAKAAHAMTAGAALGIAPTVPQVDFAAVKDHVARTIAAIAPGLGALCLSARGAGGRAQHHRAPLCHSHGLAARRAADPRVVGCALSDQ